MSFSFNKKSELEDGKNSPRFNEIHTGISDPSHKSNLNLTSLVWPKSRTLLSIISKMYSEKYINAEQRSILKEMIIDRDSTLIKYLNEYEITGDSLKMYQKIIDLSKNKTLRNDEAYSFSI